MDQLPILTESAGELGATDARTIGLIGCGLVGTALATRLLERDWKVIGFDLEPARQAVLQQLGGQLAQSARDVVGATSLVVLSLPTSRISAAVIASLPEQLDGTLIIDTTTGEPAEMQALGQAVSTRGGSYLDATIAGSSVQVRHGDVIVMAGGPLVSLQRAQPLFDQFASRTFHTGDWGSGAQMKLVVNLVLGLHRAVLAEGLSYASRCGMSPELALEILKAGPTWSRVMETKGAKMLTQDFTPHARLAQHLKDVRLILATGEPAGARLPLTTIHEQLLSHLNDAGWGDADNSAIIKAFQPD